MNEKKVNKKRSIEDKEFKFLLIDDNPSDRKLAIRQLRKSFSNLTIQEVLNEKQFENALKKSDYDLVITDYQLRWTDGLKILRRIKEKEPEKPVIMFTGTGTEQVAVDAMKEGLDDYIVKSKKHFKRLSASALSILKRDIEKKRRKEALKKSENKFKTIFENTGTGIAVVGVDQNIKMVNEKLTNILGYNREELIGKSWDFLLPEDQTDRPEKYQKDKKQKSRPLTENYTVEIPNKFGDIKNLLLNITSVPDMEDKIVSITDIQKSKEMMNALRESQKLFGLVFDNVPVGLAVLDDDRNFLHVNDTLLENLKFSETEMLDKKLEDIAVQEEREGLKEDVLKMNSKEKKKISDKTAFIDKDGKTVESRWALSLVEQPPDESDQMVFTLKIDMDHFAQ